MKIVIDVRAALESRSSQKGKYAFELVKAALPKLLDEYSIVKLVYAGTDVITNDLKDALHAEQQARVKSITFSGGPLWYLHVARWLKRQSDHIYLSPTSSLVPALVVNQSVYVTYEQIHKENTARGRLLERICERRVIRQSKQTMTVSDWNVCESSINEMLSVLRSLYESH